MTEVRGCVALILIAIIISICIRPYAAAEPPSDQVLPLIYPINVYLKSLFCSESRTGSTQ